MHISVSFVRAVVEQAERCGVDRAELLRRAGLAGIPLEDPQSRIRLESYSELQELALEASGDAAFGLHMAEHSTVAVFGMLGYLGLHTRTLREALEVFLRYRAVVSTSPGSALVEEGRHARLVYDYPRSSPTCNRLRGDFGVTTLVRIGRSYFHDIEASEIGFEHAAPDYLDEYRRLLGSRLRFEQDHTYIIFDRAWLDRPQPNANPRLCELLRPQAEEMLNETQWRSAIAEQVRRAVAECYRGTTPEMDRVARSLCMSARTLRRRLNDAGLRYGELASESLAGLAKRRLDEPSLTIRDAAHAMGFANASSFHRAFKRWTGVTPGEYRRCASARSFEARPTRTAPH